jgi:trans-aconitate methyltransferase
LPSDVTWSPDDYARNARFVSDLGAPLVELLGDVKGQRVLDVGCGDGALTERLLAAGAAVVVGIDSSAEMVAAARARGIDARVLSVLELPFHAEFDAVFSNAALHWVHDADRAIARIAAALKPGGRLVVEFGGHACIQRIVGAARTVLAEWGQSLREPWFFPTAEDYRSRLEAHGFVVDAILVFPRPTPLPTGLAGWLQTFGQPLLGALTPEQRTLAVSRMEDLLRRELCDADGQWTADYTRLRAVAHLTTDPK